MPSDGPSGTESAGTVDLRNNEGGKKNDPPVSSADVVVITARVLVTHAKAHSS